MSLRAKTLTILLCIIGAYTLGSFALTSVTVMRGFLELERAEAQRDYRRCVEAVLRETEHLDLFCNDWSAWDDTYDFVVSRDPDYIESNLTDTTFRDNSILFIHFYDVDGRLVWGTARDPSTGRELGEPVEMSSALPPDSPLLSLHGGENPLHGVYASREGLLLLAARPILTSSNEGPSRGTLIMARRLDDALTSSLVEQTNVRFTARPLAEALADPDGFASEAVQQAHAPCAHRVIDENRLDVCGVESDLLGDPAVVIRASVERRISAHGRQALQAARWSFGLGVAVLLLAILGLLSRLVVGPLSRFTRRVTEIGASGRPEERIHDAPRGEIGTLAAAFNQMMDNLESARAAELERSYYAGMAELASGVLHEVRNALSPMLGVQARLRARLTDAEAARLREASAELASAEADDERRALLERYVSLSVPTLLDRATEDADQIGARIGQVDAALADCAAQLQQGPTVERVELQTVIAHAMHMARGGPLERTPIHCDSSLQEAPPVAAHRLPLCHIVANLLMNAAEALDAPGANEAEAPAVTVSARVVAPENAPVVRLTVSDAGVGFPESHRTRLFERGFTTKPGGGAGIGLHWCAGAAAGMGARLWAESDGPGRGARFHVDLAPAGEACVPER